MTQDQKTLRTMLGGMAIIIAFSATMHVYLLKKKAIRVNRYEEAQAKTDNPDEKYLQGGGALQGEVVAVSYDKFFLRVDGKVQPFSAGSLALPEVGKMVNVTYVGGRPPTATEISALGAPVAPVAPKG